MELPSQGSSCHSTINHALAGTHGKGVLDQYFAVHIKAIKISSAQSMNDDAIVI